MSEADFDESVLLDESGAEDTLEERIHFFSHCQVKKWP